MKTKFLIKLQSWCFSLFDTAYDKVSEAAEKVASKKQADYRTLMAKDGVSPMRVWQLRRLAPPDELIWIVVENKPMSKKTLAAKRNKYLTSQYDDCEVVNISGYEHMLTLSVKPE